MAVICTFGCTICRRQISGTDAFGVFWRRKSSSTSTPNSLGPVILGEAAEYLWKILNETISLIQAANIPIICEAVWPFDHDRQFCIHSQECIPFAATIQQICQVRYSFIHSSHYSVYFFLFQPNPFYCVGA